jgi:hypothetical protein
MHRTAFMLPILLGAIHAASAHGQCFTSPQEAVSHPAAGATTSASGFRVASQRIDPFSGRTWVEVARCDHPEWPSATFASSVSASPMTGQPAIAPIRVALVRAGSRVRVVLTDDQMRVEMSAIAQTEGGLGDRIRIRIVSLSPETPEVYLTAIVRGAGYMEMAP